MENIQYNTMIEADRKKEFAVLDPLKGKTVEELAAIQAESAFPFSVCLLNVTGELNIGTIIRTSCTMGAKEVILFGRRRYDKRSAVNAWAYQKLIRVEGLQEDGVSIDCQAFWNFIETEKYSPIFIETGGIYLDRLRWKPIIDHIIADNFKPLIVMGTEGTGIPEELLKNELVVTIPMVGILRSMNVSNAAAIVIYDLKRAMCWL